MISDREMNSFVNFIFRKYNARKRSRGDIIEILVENEPIATYFIRRNGKISILYDSKDQMARKMRELVRFKLAMKESKPVSIGNEQCTRRNCYQRLIDDFKEEWEIYMNYGQKNSTKTYESKLDNISKITTKTFASNEESDEIAEKTYDTIDDQKKCKNGQCFLDVLRDFNDQLNTLLD